MQIWAGFCTRPQLLSFYIPHISQNRPQEVHVCTLEAGFLLVFDLRQGVFDILDADRLGDIAHMGKKFAFRLERQRISLVIFSDSRKFKTSVFRVSAVFQRPTRRTPVLCRLFPRRELTSFPCFSPSCLP